jgi:hypothetical protein
LPLLQPLVSVSVDVQFAYPEFERLHCISALGKRDTWLGGLRVNIPTSGSRLVFPDQCGCVSAENNMTKF